MHCLCRHFPTFSRAVLGMALLALGGMALLPLGRSLQQAEHRAGLTAPELSLAGDALAEQLSFFTLGGLRSLAAEILTLDATTAWVERDWPRAERRWEMITTLCPGRPNYWINASRDMATNAASHTARDASLSPREQEIMTRRYIARGEKFLQDGIAHNPQNPLLYMSLGDLHADLNRRPDFAAAAAAYHRAVELGASALYRRQEFYNLCRIRGREQEAWTLGRELYNTPSQRVPSLRCLLFVLQQKIDAPASERLSAAELFGSEARARQELSRFEHNQLRFPVSGIRQYLSGGTEPRRGDALGDTPPSGASW